MKLSFAPDTHLTYCTNIHPANGWPQVFSNLKRYVPRLKRRINPSQPFGLGLRLSHQEAGQLLTPRHMRGFREFCRAEGVYVFTLNGFPYGPFHRRPIKDKVHRPDWQSPNRVRYTLRLIQILEQMLPPATEGSISTSPLSYKHWGEEQNSTFWPVVTKNLIEVIHACVLVEQKCGQWIHIDIEPEPDGMLESPRDVIEFFNAHLLQAGAAELAAMLKTNKAKARDLIRRHLQVCYDVCHAAVMFQNPQKIIAAYSREGIGIGKIQISSGLKVDFSANNDAKAHINHLAKRLKGFADSTYLHQVVARQADGRFVRYRDLPDALTDIRQKDWAQWRIHYHVPVSHGRYGTMASTQDELIKALRLLKRRRYTRHLEIETYTWDVLPKRLKRDLTTSLGEEYTWVLNTLCAA